MLAITDRPIRWREMRPLLVTLLEDTAVAQKEAVVQPLEAEMARQVALWFVEQGKAMVRALARLQPDIDRNADRREAVASSAAVFREALSRDDWQYLINEVMSGNHPGGIGALRELITDYRGTAFLGGSGVSGSNFGGVGIGFAITSAEALAHAEQHAAEQVTRINDTTRESLNRLLDQALERGWGWQRTADAITQRFQEFAGKPLFPSHKFKSRAEAIAAYEIGDAYEAGSYAQIEKLRSHGAEFEKRWLNAGDERVRPAHRDNAAADYIPMDQEFPDGSLRPPSDPGCRCTLSFRQTRAVQAAGKSAEDARKEVLDIFKREQANIQAQEKELGELFVRRDELTEQIARRVNELRASGLTMEQVSRLAEIQEGATMLQALEARLSILRLQYTRTYDRLLTEMRQALTVNDPTQAPINIIIPNLNPGAREIIEEGINAWRSLVSERVMPSKDSKGFNNLYNIFSTNEGRAYFRDGDVFLAKSSGSRVVVHELGHGLEYFNQSVLDRALAFLEERTRGEPLQPLRELTGLNYRTDELTRKDKFIDAYMGKEYGGQATELISMGLEMMAYDPYTLATKDPEFFRFMYDTLRGQ